MAEISLATPEISSEPRMLTTDLTAIEEGKATPSQASTADFAASPINAHKIFAELAGTYVIIFAGCGAVIGEKRHQIDLVGVAMSWGLVVMVMIYSLGHISGGHFNPAVTIAFAVSCKFQWKEVPGYVAAQLAGSTLASLTLAALFAGEHVHIGVTVTQHIDASDLEAFLWEFIISFILMLTICGVATDSRAINELSGVTVGAAVLINVLLAGNITGASMNPARSIGPALVSKEFACLWVYVLAPTLGMVSATMIYGLLWLPSSEISDKESAKSV